ncbi:MAG: bifunctional DNA primase/polymerase, partial [Acidimicrobiales bacterium]
HQYLLASSRWRPRVEDIEELTDMDWSDSWRGAFRIELRAQAIGLAHRGWPVLPGTYPAGSQWAGGSELRHDGPSPVQDDWALRVGATAEEVAEWWSGDAYNVLVATGTVLDALEVGTDLGRRAAAVLRSAGQPVPIAATPTGRWLFLTAPGQTLPRVLTDNDDIVLHGAGSWIPLPPTAYAHGIVHWRVRPEVCGWELPAPHVVQDALVRAVAEPVELTAAPRLVGADRAVA